MSIFRGDKKALNAHLKVAKIALDEKNWEDALDTLQKALAVGETYQVLIFSGLAAYNLKKYDECESYYEKAGELQPTTPIAWKGLLECYEVRDKWEAMKLPLTHMITITKSKGNLEKSDAFTAQLATTQSKAAEQRVAEAKAAEAKKVEDAANMDVATREASPENLIAQLALAGFLQVLVSYGDKAASGGNIMTNSNYDALQRAGYGAFDPVGEVSDYVRVAKSKKPSTTLAGATYLMQVRDKDVPGTVFTQGKNTKGTTRLAGVVAARRVVMASYEFENSEQEAPLLELFAVVVNALGKKS